MADEKPGTVTLQFHYIKGPEYRELPCHGAIGGVTPQNKVWMALFTERGAIPRVVEFEVPVPEGASEAQFNELGETPSHVETRQGVIRHIEFASYLDLDVAERLHRWLGERIEELKRKAGQ